MSKAIIVVDFAYKGAAGPVRERPDHGSKLPRPRTSGSITEAISRASRWWEQWGRARPLAVTDRPRSADSAQVREIVCARTARGEVGRAPAVSVAGRSTPIRLGVSGRAALESSG